MRVQQNGYHKVLVVDDDADWRETLRIILEDQGYEVTEASDGEEALSRLSEEAFAVALLDLRMPGMNGDEVAARIPAGKGPRVVFLTGASAGEKDVQGALASGAHYYLPKDAQPEALTLLLQSLDA